MDTLGLTITGTVVGIAKAHQTDDAVDDDLEDAQALPTLAFDLQLDDEPTISSGVGTHGAAGEGASHVAVKTAEV